MQQGAIRLDAALEDSFAIQVQESVDEHLRDGIKALIKRRVAAKRAVAPPEARQEPDVPQHAPPVGVWRCRSVIALTIASPSSPMPIWMVPPSRMSMLAASAMA